jgi:hypothetical protein
MAGSDPEPELPLRKGVITDSSPPSRFRRAYFSRNRSLRSEDRRRIFSCRENLGIPSVGISLHVSNSLRRTSSVGDVKYSSSARSSNGCRLPSARVLAELNQCLRPRNGGTYLEYPNIRERRTYSHSFDHSTPSHAFILLHPDTIQDIQKPTTGNTPGRPIRGRYHTSSTVHRTASRTSILTVLEDCGGD